MTGDVVHVDPEVASLLREVAGQKASLLFAKPRWPDTRQYIRPSATGLTAPERELVVRHREYLAYLLRRAMWDLQVAHPASRLVQETTFPHLHPRLTDDTWAPALRWHDEGAAHDALQLLAESHSEFDSEEAWLRNQHLAQCAVHLEPSAVSVAYLATAFSRQGRPAAAKQLHLGILARPCTQSVRCAASLSASDCCFDQRLYADALDFIRPITEEAHAPLLAICYRFLYAFLAHDEPEMRISNALLLERGDESLAVARRICGAIARRIQLESSREHSLPIGLCPAARCLIDPDLAVKQ